MQYFPTKKITISVDKMSNKPSSFYLIYDTDFKNQTLFQRPENYYIKVLLFFSFSPDGQYINGEFGITELSFPGITSSYIFYIYASFSATDSTKANASSKNFQKIVHSEVYKLSTAEIVHVQLPVVPYFCDKNQLNKFSQIPIECIFSIVPFVLPFYRPKLRLLPTMLFSFINLIPQITEYHSNWPLVSWIRQMQYSGDASVYDLYDILFPDKEIDLSTICQGLRRQQKTQNTIKFLNDSSSLSSILYESPSITDASIDKPGLTYSQLKKIVFKMTRLISLELGLSYHLFSMEPTYDIKINGTPELLIFSPAFGVRGTILTEILCNGKLYTLHSLVREEEGNITATVYSPFTKILYDVRDGHMFPLGRQHPPLCNVNEQYLMLLYANQDVNDFFSRKARPIAPFFPRYPVVNLYECKFGHKIPSVSRKVETSSLDYDNEHVFFAFDPDTMPFPAIPLDEVCGKSVLQFDRKDFLIPTMLLWHAKRDSSSTTTLATNDNRMTNKAKMSSSSTSISIGKGNESSNSNGNPIRISIGNNSSNNNNNKQLTIVSNSNSNKPLMISNKPLTIVNNNSNNKQLTISSNNNSKQLTIVNNNNNNRQLNIGNNNNNNNRPLDITNNNSGSSSSSSNDSNVSITDANGQQLKTLLRTIMKKQLVDVNKNNNGNNNDDDDGCRSSSSEFNPFKICFVPFAHKLAKEHEIIKENPNLTFAIIQDHCITSFFNAEYDDDREITKFERSLPIHNTVCFDNEIIECFNEGSLSKYVNISFTKNNITDKYIYFVGEPLLLLIDPDVHYDYVINNLKKLYEFDHVYIRQKNIWAEVENSANFATAAETLRYIDLLIQLN